MEVLASACVLGCNCKYNGRSNRSEAVIEYLKGKEVLSICSEVLTNTSIPRPCVEIVDEVVTDDEGNNVNSDYRRAVVFALEKVEGKKIGLAILQSRSPTCGVNNIYDGASAGRLISGQGLLAKAPIIKGYPVKDAKNFNV